MTRINCQWCGSENLVKIETPKSIHFAFNKCKNCEKFVEWIKNPESPRSNSLRISKKSIKQVSEFHGFKEEFCFFCQRIRNELGWKETLTIDHIKELDKGGEDKIENMQVLCSACHKLKNWARLYMIGI